MFQLLKDPDFDFMGLRKACVALSVAVMLASVVILATKGINLGIEFAGGTELQVKYGEAPNLNDIRSRLASAGLTSQSVTTIGEPGNHEVYLRLGALSAAGEDEDPTQRVLEALRGGSLAGAVDINIADEGQLAAVLGSAPGLSSSTADSIATAILEARKDGAIFHAHDELARVEGITPEVISYLRTATVVGPLALRSQSFIGPAVGRELVNKAILAIVGSLIGMLIYIWIRFQLQWGLAAVLALVHDTVITLGLFSLFGQEMSLPVVAAFLTLIGYSVNDTVVIFDRIRENLQNPSGRGFEDTINLSINQTLSRTVITSGLTWLVVLALFLFGGSALRPFSFVLTVGVIVGTYSSIYVASPILVYWRKWVARRRAAEAHPAPATQAAGQPRRAKKVRSSKSD